MSITTDSWDAARKQALTELHQRFGSDVLGAMPAELLFIVLARLLRLENALARLLSSQGEQMSAMTDLQAAVTAQTTVVGSVQTLLAGLTEQIQDAGADPAELETLRQTITANTNVLAAAVLANTPSAVSGASAANPGTGAAATLAGGANKAAPAAGSGSTAAAGAAGAGAAGPAIAAGGQPAGGAAKS